MSDRQRVAAGLQLAALGAVAAGLAAARLAPDAYYRLVQEDELLEWTTFWAFVAAGLAHGGAALRRARLHASAAAGWFLAATALGCLVVALEEISWGQRVLGLRPPEVFLERNVQQEMNLHNLLGGIARKAGLGAILALYGLAIPAAALQRGLRRRLAAWHVVPAPRVLLPLFLAGLALQVTYPVRFSGEWVELMLAAGLLAAPLVPRRAPGLRAGAWCAAVLVLAAGATAWSRHGRTGDPQALAACRAEAEALAAALGAASLPARRDHGHARLHAFAVRYGWPPLPPGAPEERARWHLDPWQGAWWLRYERLPGGACRALVYSFGPNRIRETVGWDLAGDDVGATLEVGDCTAPAAADGPRR